MLIYCACGCGGQIIPKKHHKWKPAKFISGHNSTRKLKNGELPTCNHLNEGYLVGTKKSKRIYIHRFLMEQKLGRKLLSDELVHHINGIKTDNRIENLELITRKEHMAFHYKEREIDEVGRFR